MKKAQRASLNFSSYGKGRTMTEANTSFPLGLSSGINDKAAMYSSARQLLWIVMNWGTFNTPPAFTNSATGSLDISEDSSTIEYEGRIYDIISGNITSPSHPSWILPDVNSDLNVLDVFITFKSRDTTSNTKYIFVVLPLLRNTSVTSIPPYLGKLAGLDNKLLKAPFSLKDLLPLNGQRDFAFYSTNFTLISGLTTSGLTLIFYNGLAVPSSTLDKIRETAFPAITLPTELTGFYNRTIESASDFSKIASVSTYTTPLEKRTELTKAYNCVPLDPDVDISEGKLQFDPTSSEIIPLNKIIDERDAVRVSEVAGAVKKTGSVEQVIAVFLGILLALTVIVLLFFILSQSMGWAIFSHGLPAVPTYLYIAVGACFLGYLIGILYHA